MGIIGAKGGTIKVFVHLACKVRSKRLVAFPLVKSYLLSSPFRWFAFVVVQCSTLPSLAGPGSIATTHAQGLSWRADTPRRRIHVTKTRCLVLHVHFWPTRPVHAGRRSWLMSGARRRRCLAEPLAESKL